MNAADRSLLLRALPVGIVLALVLLVADCRKDAGGPRAASDTAAVVSPDTTYRDAALPAAITDSSRLLLRCRARRGERYRFHVRIKSNMAGTFTVTGPAGSQTVPGTSVQTNDFYFTLRIDSARADSSLHVTIWYDSLTMTIQSDRDHHAYSSNDTLQARDPENALWQALVRRPLGFVVSPLGEVKGVDDLTPLVDSLLAARPVKTNVPAETRDGLVQQLTEFGIRSQVQHVFPRFTDEPVGHDDHWSRTFPGMTEMAFPTENAVSYRLTAVGTEGTHRVGTIASNLTVKILKKEADDTTAHVTMKKAAYGGTMTTVFDLDRGITLHRTERLTTSVEMLTVGRGRFAQGNGDIVKNAVDEITVERL